MINFSSALPLDAVLYSMIGIVSLPITFLLLECSAALLPKRRIDKPREIIAAPPSVTVLIPAHNEAEVIGATLATLVPQLAPDDRVLLVADNCSDATAAIARSYGVKVIERFDTVRRGKGYALDYGLQFLQSCPPAVVIVIDADCQVHPGTLEQLARTAIETGQPVQATNLLLPPAQSAPKHAVLSFAFLLKNLVRQRGLQRLGLPVTLTGTGMAFPWACLRTVSLATGNIVEDKQLGLDLALLGYMPVFCEEALVTGTFPVAAASTEAQKVRWTHGHLQTLVTQVPQLLVEAVKQGNLSLVALALETAVPPLSLLVLMWLTTMGCAILSGALSGAWLPPIALSLQGLLLVVALMIAWSRFGRSFLPWTLLLSIPSYVLWKLPIYWTFLVSPQRAWVRTGRDTVPSTDRVDTTNQPL